MAVSDSSPKLCECGCGLPAPIAKANDKRRGHRKGQPIQFVTGHNVRPRPIAERFWSKVAVHAPHDCWEWVGSRTPAGYGLLMAGSITDGTRGARYAHRISYELHVGPIPDGLHIDHLCRNRRCVNPAHLEPVTPYENWRRWYGDERVTHCPRGHEYTPENTGPDGRGRRCLTCHRERERNRARARRQSEGAAQ